MLVRVIIVEHDGLALSFRELRALRDEFPGVEIRAEEAARFGPDVRQRARIPARPDIPPEIAIDTGAFWAADFDAYEVDRTCEELAAQGSFALRLVGHGVSAPIIDAVFTRFQRFTARRNPVSTGPVFDGVLACHRALHDCCKPLVRADFDHALDTWQWLLRLDPGAGLAVQVAALFHDVERLASEADVRIEQHASDYRAFKNQHARRGGDMTRDALAATDLDQAIVDRAAELVAGHEQPGGQREDRVEHRAERLLLNEADALSFFSLNSAGFLRYYGVEHTRRKVAYTLARLRESVRWRLGRMRFHPAVADMLHQAGVTTYTRQERDGERSETRTA